MSRADTVLEVCFAVDFVREFHVGAAHGTGTDADAALFTEHADGVEQPALRATHGLLRQALFDLLALLPLAGLRRCPASGGPEKASGRTWCGPDEATDPCPICRIFGSAALPSPWRFSTLRPRERMERTDAGGPPPASFPAPRWTRPPAAPATGCSSRRSWGRRERSC
jgi:hypothetical protein